MILLCFSLKKCILGTVNFNQESPMTTPDFDIIIVGTGPAGLGAAFHLTEHAPSRSILMVDREKICSGDLLNDCKQNYTYPNW